MDLDPRFTDDFERLIRLEKLDDLEGFMQLVGLFEEVPLYSRISQLSFLRGLSPTEKNRISYSRGSLVSTSHHRLLARVLRRSNYDFFCMISVLDWEDFNEDGLLTPTFWYTNPSRGDQISLESPSSTYSTFVADSLDRDPSFKIREGLAHLPGGPYIERVYAQLVAWLGSSGVNISGEREDFFLDYDAEPLER